MFKKNYAFWCRYPSHRNFGDALTPWLIKKIAGQYPDFLWPHHQFDKYLVVGSIIAYAREHCIVWGAGILWHEERISPKARLIAVRGPITRKRALECGAECPKTYGDPALLLPRLYPVRKTTPEFKLGIVPHYIDKPKVLARWKGSPKLRFIDVQQPVESVVNAIVSCQFIASSSLHGIIVANAYGIPALWVEFSKRPHGDGSKFQDYFLSIGQKPYAPLPLDENQIEYEMLIEYMRPLKMQINLDQLWQSCPFRTDR
jgi:pyruvyltransferase